MPVGFFNRALSLPSWQVTGKLRGAGGGLRHLPATHSLLGFLGFLGLLFLFLLGSLATAVDEAAAAAQ